MHSLDDMQLFVEVVKAKGFTAAAEKLAIPKSTLSVRITKLEKMLGLRLLHRTTRKIELTEAGTLYFERAEKVVEAARIAHEQLGDLLAKPQGTLRISAPADFAHHFVVPLLDEFYQRYPQITLDFDLSPRRVDLLSEPFDLAIRAGDTFEDSLIARPLATFSSGVYTSPDYLARHGEPQTVEQLSEHHCLRFSGFAAQGWKLFAGEREITVAVQGRFLANSLEMMLQLANNGLGIAILPDQIAEKHTRTGKLKRLFPDWHSHRTIVYALTATRLLPAKVQAFIRFLQERLGGGE